MVWRHSLLDLCVLCCVLCYSCLQYLKVTMPSPPAIATRLTTPIRQRLAVVYSSVMTWHCMASGSPQLVALSYQLPANQVRHNLQYNKHNTWIYKSMKFNKFSTYYTFSLSFKRLAEIRNMLFFEKVELCCVWSRPRRYNYEGQSISPYLLIYTGSVRSYDPHSVCI